MTLDIDAEHAGIAAQLHAIGGQPRVYAGDYDSYSGSGRPTYRVATPERRRIVREWLAAHRKAPDAELLAMANRLFDGETHDERTMAALLLGYSARTRAAASLAMVDGWLGQLQGWAEVDSFCASVFTAADMAADWPAWRGLLEALSRNPNINKRRAALVLLTTPTRTSDDPRFADLAFALIDRLQAERDILITKAVSWLLRSMAARHGPAVAAYLAANAETLPAIAVRETRVKLATGTKSGRSKRQPK